MPLSLDNAVNGCQEFIGLLTKRGEGKEVKYYGED
jgi:hypothetical protein